MIINYYLKNKLQYINWSGGNNTRNNNPHDLIHFSRNFNLFLLFNYKISKQLAGLINVCSDFLKKLWNDTM